MSDAGARWNRMNLLSDFKNPELAQKLAAAIAETAGDRQFSIMEVCGGQTHTIYKYRLREMLPPGLIGFVFGDYFLFKAFALIGARVSMLIMTLVPPITAVIGWLIIGESMTLLEITGMILTVSGIGMAIFSRSGNGKSKRIKLSYPVKGILLAFGGTVGQAVGLVLSKYGMGDYHAFAATQIRIIAGMIGFALIIILLKKGGVIRNAFKSRPGMIGTGVGSVFGPFLGVSFSLLAVKYAATGVASTIMAIVPILIIPPSVIFFRQKVTWLEILGAFISVGGVTLFFI